METLRSLLDFFVQRSKSFWGNFLPVPDICKVPLPHKIQPHVFQNVGNFLEGLSCFIGFQGR